MGCVESKIENEEIVIRCKERKQLIARAVTARNKFAAAHSAHAMSLKNSGASLSDFAHGEVVFPTSTTVIPTPVAPATPPPVPYENFIVPPPPLPARYNTSLQRASTMPEFAIPRPANKNSNPIMEEVNEDDGEAESTHSLNHLSSKSGQRSGLSSPEISTEDVTHERRKSEPHTEQQQQRPLAENKEESTWDFFFSMENVPGPTLSEVEENPSEREEIERKLLEEMAKKREIDSRKKQEAVDVEARSSEPPSQPPPIEKAPETPKIVKRVKLPVPSQGKKIISGSNLNLVQIFADIDDCFLKASQSAHDVSRMLEATRLHYHSNFADKSGHINHSERVMQVIMWNRSFRGLPNANDGMDDLDADENETHATVLDKILAWEKKLYEEVKDGEQMKLEYQRKVAQLNKLKKRGSSMEALERMKAAVSHLHTRYIVDMQSMDSTVSEINRLRDAQLYPKLVALVDEMATMWETVKIHHENQCKIAQALRLLGDSQSPKETSDHHFERTRELGGVVQDWHTNISEFMTQQKDYIKTLNSWLNLNLVAIDTNLKEKASSPDRHPNPPIKILLQAWNGYLEKIPDESAKAAINSFAATIQAIWHYQREEMDFRKRCADSRKDLVKKTRDFENWYNKYMQKRTPPDDMDPDRAHDKDLFTERQHLVEAAKQKLESDDEAYQKLCIQVRQKSLTSLKSKLPELFQALSYFALACSEMYSNLRSITHQQKETS